jgi:COP9 signalosome complex subunit 3
MSDLVAKLCTVPSRRHGSANMTDEEYDRQLRDLIAYLKQPGLVPGGANINEYFEVRQLNG